MSKVLVTGGSGFIAVHIIDLLFKKGYKVITTVRSEEKGQYLKEKFAGHNLETAIVQDIAVEGAFNEVIKTPGIEYVLHTASPFHFKSNNPRDFIDPAVTGTTSILTSIADFAPGVKQVVVTSSFASILDEKHMDKTGFFTEESWNPATEKDAEKDPRSAYVVSKLLAEKAAWRVVKERGNPFALTTVCPPLVFGPVLQKLTKWEDINTSNAAILPVLQGQWKDRIPDNERTFLWVDVRDVAKAHVLALEKEAAKGVRLFTASGFFHNKEIARIIYDNFPEVRDRVPGPDAPGGAVLAEEHGWDNSKTREILGMQWHTLEESIRDLAGSIIELEKKIGK